MILGLFAASQTAVAMERRYQQLSSFGFIKQNSRVTYFTPRSYSIENLKQKRRNPIISINQKLMQLSQNEKDHGLYKAVINGHEPGITAYHKAGANPYRVFREFGGSSAISFIKQKAEKGSRKYQNIYTDVTGEEWSED